MILLDKTWSNMQLRKRCILGFHHSTCAVQQHDMVQASPAVCVSHIPSLDELFILFVILFTMKRSMK